VVSHPRQRKSQPLQPTPNQEWNTATKRWQLTAAVQGKQPARSSSLAQIPALEASQPRAVRDWAITGDVSRLKAIKKLRADLKFA
jgi:hypothetical protein